MFRKHSGSAGAWTSQNKVSSFYHAFLLGFHYYKIIQSVQIFRTLTEMIVNGDRVLPLIGTITLLLCSNTPSVLSHLSFRASLEARRLSQRKMFNNITSA